MKLAYPKIALCGLILLTAGLFNASAATHFVDNISDSSPGSLRATVAAAADGDTVPSILRYPVKRSFFSQRS